MAESGVDLSYDDPRPVPVTLSASRMSTGGQPPRGPGPSGTLSSSSSSERLRVVVGSRQTPSSLPSNVSHSMNKKSRSLRSSQRLMLMKEQADAEVKRQMASMAPLTSEALSLPQTANNTFLANFLPHSLMMPGQLSGAATLPNLHDYAASSLIQSRSSIDLKIDDEDELLKDIDNVLTDDLSSYGSSFNTPSVTNSCIVDFPNDFQDVQMEEEYGNTSTSCPLIPLRPAEPIAPYRGGRRKEPPPPFLNEESKILWIKEREKKDQHNNIEKKRRSKINDYIHEMATLLPENYDIDLQNKKGNILEASVDYIRKLQNEAKRTAQMKKQQDELEKQNRKLQLQIQLLQLSLNAAQSTQTQAPLQIPVQQQPVVAMPNPVQIDGILDLQQNPLRDDINNLDLMNADLNLFPDNFDLSQFDSIFSGHQVESSGSAGTGASQIPVTVDEYMEFTM